eukprot:26783-Chlamydomonas_euryale.AAC.3
MAERGVYIHHGRKGCLHTHPPHRLHCSVLPHESARGALPPPPPQIICPSNKPSILHQLHRSFIDLHMMHGPCTAPTTHQSPPHPFHDGTAARTARSSPTRSRLPTSRTRTSVKDGNQRTTRIAGLASEPPHQQTLPRRNGRTHRSLLAHKKLRGPRGEVGAEDAAVAAAAAAERQADARTAGRRVSIRRCSAAAGRCSHSRGGGERGLCSVKASRGVSSQQRCGFLGCMARNTLHTAFALGPNCVS